MASRKKSTRPRSRRRRVFMFVVIVTGLYLLGTGPALWSRTKIDHRSWQKSVIYYVAPLMWLNDQFRAPSTLEKVGAIDLLPSENTFWYRWFESYWGLFGAETRSESRRVALLLKIKFHGE